MSCRCDVAAGADVGDVAVSSARRSRLDVAVPAADETAAAADSPGPAARGRGGVPAVSYPSRSVFRPTPRNVTVSPGDRAVLKCRVENLGTKTVRARASHNSHVFHHRRSLRHNICPPALRSCASRTPASPRKKLPPRTSTPLRAGVSSGGPRNWW